MAIIPAQEDVEAMLTALFMKDRGPRRGGVPGRAAKDREAARGRDEAPDDEARDGRSRSRRKKKKAARFLKGVLIDVAIAFTIIVVILAALWAYTGNWPPVVVVESESMMHGSDSSVGTIDTGDLVMVKSVDSRGDIVTYIEGKHEGYKRYDDYGDVIVYQKNGYDEYTPVIHRAVLYLEYNSTGGGFDIPALEDLRFGEDADWYVDTGGNPEFVPSSYNMQGQFILPRYGHTGTDLLIKLNSILNTMSSGEPHSGFITKGDNNNQAPPGSPVDQGEGLQVAGEAVRPVKVDWVVGIAKGELPWFGLMKLMINKKVVAPNQEPGPDQGVAPETSFRNLIASLVVIIAIPICIDVAMAMRERRRRRRKEEEGEGDGDDGDGGEGGDDAGGGRGPGHGPDDDDDDDDADTGGKAGGGRGWFGRRKGNEETPTSGEEGPAAGRVGAPVPSRAPVRKL